MFYKKVRKIGFFTLAIYLLMTGCKESHRIDDSISQKYESESTMDFIIGTYTRKEGHVDGRAKGIYWMHRDTSEWNGYVKAIFESGINPSFLAFDPEKIYVYAVNETGGRSGEPEGSIQAFSFDRAKGILKLINNESSHGVAPCFISVTSDARNVLVANYVSGTIAVYPILMGGALGVTTDVIQFEGSGPDPRQEGPHAHFIKQGSDGAIYTADLGTDSIRIYSLEEGKLLNMGKDFKVRRGAGPRHIEFHPLLDVLYILNELNGSIEVFRIPNEDGEYQNIQIISTLEESDSGFAGCADIHITPNGRYLYASNRGDYDNLAIYDVSSDDGSLRLLGHQSSEGAVPRNFIITADGERVIVVNQNSDNLVIFQINDDGHLVKEIEVKDILSPVCIIPI